MKETADTAAVDVAEDANSHTRKMLEEEYNAKLLTADEVVELGYGEFVDWLTFVTPYGNLKNCVLFFNLGYSEPLELDDQHPDPPPPRVKALFFTDSHSYAIHAQLRDGGGYLGAYAGTRKPRPGETWTRGNDLPDGRYCKNTFDKIMRSIVRYEMKRLQCWVK